MPQVEARNGEGEGQPPDVPPGHGVNPLLQPETLTFGAPEFDLIREEHFRPAFQEGMRRQRDEVAAIAASPEPASFQNTIDALERSGQLLTRVARIFFTLTSAHTNPELDAIQAEFAPQLAAHADDILLDRGLYRRVRELFEVRDRLHLDREELRILEHLHRRFVRAGALLDAEGQARIRAINEELSSLSTQFQQNLLAVTRERALLVEDESELEGLTPSEIKAAAEAARERGEKGKYLLSLTNTTRQPILARLRNRALRRRLWEASANRGVGEGGGVDSRPLLLRIALLRAERARLQGYRDWASFALEPQMARTPAAALGMLTELVPAVTANARQEAAAIQAVIRGGGESFSLEPWDWEFYAERVRMGRHQLREEEIRPYFPLERVLVDGVFHTMGLLYGISFVERRDLPVYHPDVRVFDVLDAEGSPLGLFYGDYFARESKRGGAWMSTLALQSLLLDRKPVITNVLNIPRPPAGEPALLSFDQVTTLFHEMGHAVHGLLSRVRYPSLAGTSVPRDFVEFPSTFQEDWALEPSVLVHYARHHETGEVIPPGLVQRILGARYFNQGYDTLEYLAAALVDLAWHTLGPEEIPEDPQAFEAAVLARWGVDDPRVPPRYRSPYFAHIWSGGYGASYYAYLWSEVLAADAFAWVEGRGGPTRENGERHRAAVLSRGWTAEPMELYVAFRGREPEVTPLLRRRGLRLDPSDQASSEEAPGGRRERREPPPA